MLLHLLVLIAQPKVDVEPRVVGAFAEVSDLGTRLKEKITLKGDLSKHILAITADDSNPEYELAAVAAALRAQITKDGSSIVLSREPADIEKDRAEWSKAWSVWLKEGLAKAKQVRKQYDADRDPAGALRVQIDEIQRVSQVRNMASDHDLGREIDLAPLSPGGNLVLKLFDKIGVDEIARLPMGKPVVFESRPTPFSVPLSACDDITEIYRKELGSLPDLKSMVRPGIGAEIFNEKGIGATAPEINLLRLTIAAQEETVNGRVEAFDKNGRLVGNGVLVLKPYPGPIGNDLLVEARNRPQNSKTNIELPRSLVDRINGANRLSPHLPAWMVAPTKWEPFSLGAGFAMQCLAGIEAKQVLVVDLCDDLFRYAKTCIHGNQLNLPGFSAILDEWKPYERVNDGNYTVLRPANPDSELPIDRKLLQEMASTALSSGREDVRLAAAVCRQSSSPIFGEVRGAINLLLRLRPPENLTADHGTLCLIGAISDDGWNRLINGQILTVDQLGIVDDYKEFLKSRFSQDGDQSLPQLYRYTQELYRNAPLGETPIKIQRQLEPEFRLRDPSNGPQTQWRELSQIGAHVVINAALVDGNITYSESRDDFEARLDSQFLFQTGTLRTESFIVGMPLGRPLSYSLVLQIDGVSDEVHYLELPQAIRDIFWQDITLAARNRLATASH